MAVEVLGASTHVGHRSVHKYQISLIHKVISVPSSGGLSVPIRARLYVNLYVSAHQGQVIMSVLSRARLLCQCPAGPGYYVSAQ